MIRLISLYRKTLLLLCTTVLMALVLNVGLQISARWLSFKVPTWTEELGSFLIKWIVAFACGLQFLDKDPIGIDMLFVKMGAKVQKVLRFGSILIACAFAVLMTYSSIELIKKGMRMRTPIMDLQYAYVYLSIFLTGLLILASVLFRQYKLYADRKLSSVAGGIV